MILDCYKVLKRIEPRPAMWTGAETLESIRNYISGYYQALIDLNIVQKFDNVDEEPFFDWVAHKLGYSESTAGWVNMILAYSIGLCPEEINWNDFTSSSLQKEQHLESIDKFYQLVEEFKSEIDDS